MGDEIELRIIKLNPAERKIGLSWKATPEEAERHQDAEEPYREGDDGSATLADLFQAKDAEQ